MPPDLHFTDEPLSAIGAALAEALTRVEPGDVVRFTAPDPDRAGLYDGEPVDGGRHRGLAGWVQLAEQLGAALLVPRPAGGGRVIFGLRRLDPDASWQLGAAPSGDPEKYGARSGFARVHKFEEAPFLYGFVRALAFVDPAPGARVLALGCNRGDELEALERLRPDHAFDCLGIDHAASAIDEARRRHPHMRFEVGDVSRLAQPDPERPPPATLGRFDLVLALNVLHSPSLDGKAILRRLVAAHLTPAGSLIVGLPNVRYVDHGLRYGARVKGFGHPELSVMIRDAAFYRRYLASHRFRVMITGQHTVFVSARPLPARARRP